ncbi:hypothetical protein [Polymorphospora sp. NPDC050346]|uniref:hypothetical protein n=1 Tax=Polymorphospora sp. NPDC050346 TaxID=3155780 RepID=UPI0033D10D9E
MLDVEDNTFVRLINDAHSRLVGDVDPDGLHAQWALLLVERAAAVASTPGCRGADDWDFFAVALGDAVAELRAELPDPAAVPSEVRPSSDQHLRPATLGLVRKLAQIYTDGAASNQASPWRRLVWIRVADLLDGAARQLT